MINWVLKRINNPYINKTNTQLTKQRMISLKYEFTNESPRNFSRLFEKR